MTTRRSALLALYSLFFLVAPVALVYLALAVPSPWKVSGDGGLLLLTALLGLAMGAVHGLASLAAHAGKGDLAASWTLFYLCRPFTGAGIAIVTVLLLLSGLGGFNVPTAQPQREYVLLAWAALAGLYSQPALDKLKEIFATVFATKGGNGNGSGGAASSAAPPVVPAGAAPPVPAGAAPPVPAGVAPVAPAAPAPAET